MKVACNGSTFQRKPGLKKWSPSSSYWYCRGTELHNTGDKRVKVM